MIEKCNIFRVIVIIRSHYFIIVKLFRVIKGFILNQIKQTDIKSDYDFTIYGKFTDTSLIEELHTRKPSPLFGPLGQYLGSDKRRVLSPCATFRQVDLILYLFVYK